MRYGIVSKWECGFLYVHIIVCQENLYVVNHDKSY